MNKMMMSRAASALLRALLDRAGDYKNRILLTGIGSVDWQSLTFTGEQHRILLRITGDRVDDVVQLLTFELEETEFVIPGQIVADISAGNPIRSADGSVHIRIDALTIAE